MTGPLFDRPAWHALFAPLPADVVLTRQPVTAMDGWEQIAVHLSDAGRGLRAVLVVVDASGALLSASDHVYHRIDGDPPQARHESVGGRFEPDGTFHGTHWLSVGSEPAEDDWPRLESTPRPPTADEVRALRALVDDVLRRSPRQP